MRVLVTGGTGFIGSHVVHVLSKEGYKVTALARALPEKKIEGVEYVTADLSMARAELRNILRPFESVIHLASLIPSNSHEEPSAFERANVEATRNLLQALSVNTTQVIYGSTVDVYGPAQSELYRENQSPMPQNDYARTKLEGERLVRAWGSEKGKTETILRLSQVYGYGEPQTKVIPLFLMLLKAQKPLQLVAGGRDKRRYLEVRDAAAAFLYALKVHISGTFNIAGEEITDTRTIIALLEDILGRTIPVEDMPGEASGDRVMAINAVREQLGFSPSISLHDGLSVYCKNIELQ